MQLPWLINNRVTRFIVDEVLVRLTSTVIVDLLGASHVAAHHVLVTEEEIMQTTARGVVTLVWTVNQQHSAKHFRALGAAVITDSAFSEDLQAFKLRRASSTPVLSMPDELARGRAGQRVR